MSLFSDRCTCAYCSAVIEPAEADVARKILFNLADEAFFEVITAMRPPAIEHAHMCNLGVEFFACLECVTGALFSLVTTPGGHCAL